jgi:hypothetical protein
MDGIFDIERPTRFGQRSQRILDPKGSHPSEGGITGGSRVLLRAAEQAGGGRRLAEAAQEPIDGIRIALLQRLDEAGKVGRGRAGATTLPMLDRGTRRIGRGRAVGGLREW